MAHATVCDPCYQEGKLEQAEEMEWSLGEAAGTLALCHEHYANYVRGWMEVGGNGHRIDETFPCDEPGCERTFPKHQGLMMHKRRAHG